MNVLSKKFKIFYFRKLSGSFRFSINTPQTIKEKTPSEKARRVKSEMPLPYVPMQKLEFQRDGRCLIYFYQSKMYTNSFYYSKYYAAFFYIAYLIKHNPWFMSFPASLPLMFIAEAMIMKRIMTLMRVFRQSIREIYLHSDGLTLEIIYDTQFWRKFKKDDFNEFLHIPLMKNPPKGPEMPPLSGDLFPEVYPFENDGIRRYAWTKYYGTPRDWITIPKAYKYANMEVLTAAFRGIPIEISKRTITEIDYKKKDKYMD